jgi:RimJ/RimL family protein N-acetyltransferase
MNDPAFLRGERVSLRPVERDDVDLLQRVRTDPGFRHSLGFDRPWNRERTEAFFEDVVVGDEDSLNFVVGVDGDDAGAVSLFDVDRVGGEVSYWLLPGFRGEGYATESLELLLAHAFDELGLHRVTARVFADNDASTRLLTRLGFDHEGTTREARIAGGEYRDVEQYGLLAAETELGGVRDD